MNQGSYKKNSSTFAVYLAVTRFEIFQDASHPEDLRWDFVQEFLSLPTSFFAAGAAKKFRKQFEPITLIN